MTQRLNSSRTQPKKGVVMGTTLFVKGTTLFTNGTTRNVPTSSCHISRVISTLGYILGGAVSKKGGALNNTPQNPNLVSK